MNFSLQPLSLQPPQNSMAAQALAKTQSQKPLTPETVSSPSANKTVSVKVPFSTPTLNSLGMVLNPLKSSLNPLSGMGTHSDEQLKKVSKDFEAVFLRMLFKEMRDSVPKSNLLGNSHAMEFFQTMQDEQLSEKMASAGGIGLGSIIYQRLKNATAPHQKSFS